MSQSRPPSSSDRHRHSNNKPLATGSLHVKVKYNNTLPDIPFDPKFLVSPLDVSRYVDYRTTSLEHNSKHELLTSTDLGVDIDLILPERYAIPDVAVHEPEDERLINDDEPLSQLTKKSPRDKSHSVLHNKVVPWLKKTEYISTEFSRYGASSEKTETKIGYTVRKSMKEDQIFLDKESQIKAINQTFEAAQKPIEKHPTKPDVYAERVLPLLPDFEMWKYLFAHVKFDSEPADPSKADHMSQAIVRGAYDEESQENFVVYFLPTEVTMADRLLDQNNGLEYSEGKEYEYKSSREYTWQAKQDNQGDDFFFVFRDDAVYYNRLSMEVTLKKRRIKSQNSTVSTLVVRNRPMNEEELQGQEEKLKQLRKPSPPVQTETDLTAMSLEQSYEEQNKVQVKVEETPASPTEPQQSDHSASSSSSSASASGSDASSSASSTSSSEDESEDEDDDNPTP